MSSGTRGIAYIGLALALTAPIGAAVEPSFAPSADVASLGMMLLATAGVFDVVTSETVSVCVEEFEKRLSRTPEGE